MFYIGNTQQKMKARMGQHDSNSFASHYASHVTKGTRVTPSKIREIMNFGVLWQGDPMNCGKISGKLNCSLCMKERIEFLQAQQQDEITTPKSSVRAGITRSFTGSSKMTSM